MPLPTGLSKQLPSGVNNTLPALYTVPHKLENWKLFCARRKRYIHVCSHIKPDRTKKSGADVTVASRACEVCYN